MHRRSFLGFLGGAFALAGVSTEVESSDYGHRIRIDEWEEDINGRSLRRIHIETEEDVSLSVMFRNPRDNRTYLVPLTDGDFPSVEDRLRGIIPVDNSYDLHITHSRGGVKVEGLARLVFEPSVDRMLLTVPVRFIS